MRSDRPDLPLPPLGEACGGNASLRPERAMARATRGMPDSGSRSGTSPSSSASSPQRGRWRCAEAGARVQKAFVIVHKRTVRGAGSSRAPQLGGHWSREQAEALLFSGGAGPLCDGVSVGGQDRPQETGRMSILLPGSPGKRPVVWREGSRCLCPRGGGRMG